MSKFAAAIVALTLSSTAMAACPPNLICASDPQTVVAALTAAGYRAKLSKDNTGDPMVESAAAGYNFDVLFYGCKEGKECASLQFRSGFSADKAHTLQLVNDWNVQKRFTQLSMKPDTSLQLNYDVTTEGGLTKDNFADVVDWWQVMLGELGKFLSGKSST